MVCFSSQAAGCVNVRVSDDMLDQLSPGGHYADILTREALCNAAVGTSVCGQVTLDETLTLEGSYNFIECLWLLPSNRIMLH